jgi:hypothetical protein
MNTEPQVEWRMALLIMGIVMVGFLTLFTDLWLYLQTLWRVVGAMWRDRAQLSEIAMAMSQNLVENGSVVMPHAQQVRLAKAARVIGRRKRRKE